jgi:hypothetical protein
MISADYGKGGRLAVFRKFHSVFQVGIEEINSRVFSGRYAAVPKWRSLIWRCPIGKSYFLRIHILDPSTDITDERRVLPYP